MDREARAATIALERLDAETTCGRVLLAVDAAALVYAEKKGLSQTPRICEFVETARSRHVRVIHIRSEANVADAQSRGKEPPSEETVRGEVRKLSETFERSRIINEHPRSRW